MHSFLQSPVLRSSLDLPRTGIPGESCLSRDGTAYHAFSLSPESHNGGQILDQEQKARAACRKGDRSEQRVTRKRQEGALLIFLDQIDHPLDLLHSEIL